VRPAKNPNETIISNEGLALLVAELEATQAANRVLTHALKTYQQVKCPEPVADVTPFGWGDLFVAAGVGALVTIISIGGVQLYMK